MPIRRAAIVLVLAFLTVTTHRGDWEHVPWRDGPFVSVTPPAVADPDHTLAIVTGHDPVGWVIPYFPPQIPFIRIQGYLNYPGQPPNGMNARAQAAIATHQGPLFLLFPIGEIAGADDALAAYGLRMDRASCQAVPSNLGDYVHWCRVYRSDAPAGPA